MPKYYIPKEAFVIIDAEEIKRYIDAAPDMDMAVFLATCWLTGSRINEIVGLQRHNINIDYVQETLQFSIKAQKHGKIGYPSFSFFDPFVRDMLLPYFEFTREGNIFQRKKRSYQAALLRLNKHIYGFNTEKYITFHQLRHSRISFLARDLQASPEELKSWTGHRASSFEFYFAPRRVDRFRGKMK